MCESSDGWLTVESCKFGFNRNWWGDWVLSRPTERSNNGFITYENIIKLKDNLILKYFKT